VSSLFKNLEKILAVYFDKQFISEYKKSFQKKKTAQTISPEQERNQEQLSTKIQFSGDYQSRIDLIITLAQDQLDTIKFIEFLLHLGEFTISQGEFGTALLIYGRALDQASSPELESFSAYANLAIGDLYSRQADWNNSLPFITKASELFERQKDYKGMARCENLLGTVYGDLGDINQAQYHFEKSLTHLEPKKDDIMIGMLELNLGVLYVLQGHYDTALSYYHRALIKFEQVQDVRRIAEAKNDLGLLYTHKGEYDNAFLEYDKSIAISLNINYLYALGVSYLSKGYIFAQTGDYVLASAFTDKAMDIAYKINDRLSIADIYKIKGVIDRNQKKYETAENYFRTSIRINRELENILNEAEACYEFGLLFIETGDIPAAREQLNSALNNYTKMNSSVLIEKVNKVIRTLPTNKN
jgi:tetratricopeptide (TPR) repeat protein